MQAMFLETSPITREVQPVCHVFNYQHFITITPLQAWIINKPTTPSWMAYFPVYIRARRTLYNTLLYEHDADADPSETSIT